MVETGCGIRLWAAGATNARPAGAAADVAPDVRAGHWLRVPFAAVLSVDLFGFAVQDHVLHQRAYVSIGWDLW